MKKNHSYNVNATSNSIAEVNFINIFKSYEKELYEKIIPLCKSEHFAKDIMQDVFLKLWINRDILEDILDVRAYLYAMAQNRVFNLLKRAAIDKRIKTAIWNQSKLSSAVTEEQVILKEYEELLSKAIQELPPQRRIVYLLHKDGYSYNEISQNLGISKHTIKNQIYSSVKLIKKIFGLHAINLLLLLICTFTIRPSSTSLYIFF